MQNTYINELSRNWPNCNAKAMNICLSGTKLSRSAAYEPHKTGSYIKMPLKGNDVTRLLGHMVSF